MYEQALKILVTTQREGMWYEIVYLQPLDFLDRVFLQ